VTVTLGMSASSIITNLRWRESMLPTHRVPTHPGEILTKEFLGPLGVTQVGLAQHIGVPVQRINEISRGKRGVTPETAWLLAQAFETTPEFWMNLQLAHDLARNRPRKTLRRLRKAG
jgi:addiction module HigA family antidote